MHYHLHRSGIVKERYLNYALIMRYINKLANAIKCLDVLNLLKKKSFEMTSQKITTESVVLAKSMRNEIEKLSMIFVTPRVAK